MSAMSEQPFAMEALGQPPILHRFGFSPMIAAPAKFQTVTAESVLPTFPQMHQKSKAIDCLESNVL
jgi:hypothetical protein